MTKKTATKKTAKVSETDNPAPEAKPVVKRTRKAAPKKPAQPDPLSYFAPAPAPPPSLPAGVYVQAPSPATPPRASDVTPWPPLPPGADTSTPVARAVLEGFYTTEVTVPVCRCLPQLNFGSGPGAFGSAISVTHRTGCNVFASYYANRSDRWVIEEGGITFYIDGEDD